MRNRSLQLLIHLTANGLLLLLGYYWLSIPESRAGTLAWSICVALCFLVVASSTYTVSFIYPSESSLARAWRIGLRNALPVMLSVIAMALLYWLLSKGAVYSARPAFRIASWLTLKLQTPVRPASVVRVFNSALWVVQWVVLPVLFLPALSAISASGWRNFRPWRWPGAKWMYWIETPLLLLCAVRIPLLLLNWVPRLNGFGVQMASFVCRAAVAYLLFGAAWLVLAFITAAGTPRPTQPSTAGSP
jgi:hypothetical protein